MIKKSVKICKNTPENYDSSSILVPKHDQIAFLLIKVDTSRLHQFEVFEYLVQKKILDKF